MFAGQRAAALEMALSCNSCGMLRLGFHSCFFCVLNCRLLTCNPVGVEVSKSGSMRFCNFDPNNFPKLLIYLRGDASKEEHRENTRHTSTNLPLKETARAASLLFEWLHVQCAPELTPCKLTD